MRRSALALVLASLTPALPSQAQPIEDIHARPLRAERSRDVDVLHYRIELRFDEEQRSFRGRTSVSMRSLRDELDTVSLDAETFVVERVEDPDGRPLAFTQVEGILEIRLASGVSYGDELEVSVIYGARGVDVESERFGLAPDYDLGLDFKAATEDNPRLINTLSWPEGARHWFPSYDHPNDRATQEVVATVREDYQVISNGALVSVRPGSEPGTRVWHWSQELPHPTYLFVLVAGPYVSIEDTYRDRGLRYWVYEKDVSNARRSFGKTKDMMAFFEAEYGYPYPWNKYDQITIPGIGGGAESTSATVVGHSTIHDERAEQDFPSHGLVAHELAHQWWGNLVSYRDWSEAWLSESFATYGEHLFTRHDLGEDEGSVDLLDKKEAYLREARERYQRPIVFRRWRYPNDNFDRHTYQKGAVVLSMLRFVMGDAAFRRAVTHFLQTHAFEPVDTHDLVKAIRTSTGRNLEWFFDQWIYRPGHPVLDVSYEWSEANGALSLRVRQLQDRSRGAPVFRAPVDVRVETRSSRKIHRIWLSREEDTFELAAAEPPLLVRFDAGNRLLKEWTFEKFVEELLYQLDGDDVIGRMWAAGELSKHAARRDVAGALTRAAMQHPFWSVRVAAVEALAAGRAAPVSLLRRTSLDESSRVRAASVRALGELRDPALAPFFEARFREDDSYVVQAAALHGLGTSGDPSVRPLLEAAAILRSPRDVLARAARSALAAIER